MTEKKETFNSEQMVLINKYYPKAFEGDAAQLGMVTNELTEILAVVLASTLTVTGSFRKRKYVKTVSDNLLKKIDEITQQAQALMEANQGTQNNNESTH